MNLPKLKTRDKMLLGAGIAAIAIVAIRNYYVDTSKVLKKLKEDVTIPETRFLVIRDVVAPGEKDYNEILKKVEAHVKARESDVTKREEILPNKTMRHEVMARIVDMAEASDVKIINFDSQSGFEKKDVYEDIPIKLDARCRYESVLKFMDKLRAFPHKIENFKVTISKEGLPNLDMRLELIIYVQ